MFFMNRYINGILSLIKTICFLPSMIITGYIESIFLPILDIAISFYLIIKYEKYYLIKYVILSNIFCVLTFVFVYSSTKFDIFTSYDQVSSRMLMASFFTIAAIITHIIFSKKLNLFGEIFKRPIMKETISQTHNMTIDNEDNIISNKKVVCTNCGILNEIDDIICNECGFKLK